MIPFLYLFSSQRNIGHSYTMHNTKKHSVRITYLHASINYSAADQCSSLYDCVPECGRRRHRDGWRVQTLSGYRASAAGWRFDRVHGRLSVGHNTSQVREHLHRTITMHKSQTKRIKRIPQLKYCIYIIVLLQTQNDTVSQRFFRKCFEKTVLSLSDWITKFF